jgi:hypothetical protein
LLSLISPELVRSGVWVVRPAVSCVKLCGMNYVYE